jgi:hypothetical protein
VLLQPASSASTPTASAGASFLSFMVCTIWRAPNV